MTMAVLTGYASRSFQDGPLCGDGWWSAEVSARGSGDADRVQRMMLADGIGHGSHAHRIVQRLGEQLTWICRRSTGATNLTTCVRDLHQRLKELGHNAQAALALLDLDPRSGQLSAVVIGNIQMLVLSPEKDDSLPAQAGMLGGRLPSRLATCERTIDCRTLLAVHSDGVAGAGLREHLRAVGMLRMTAEPRLQDEAAAIVQRFGSPADDASCALIRIDSPWP
jgi:hypothetical protein